MSVSGNCKLGNNCSYSLCSFEHDLDVFVEDNVNQNHVHNADEETVKLISETLIEENVMNVEYEDNVTCVK